jgi:Subtilase family
MIPPNTGPEDPVTVAVLKDPSVTYEVDGDTLVMAIKDQLLVHTSAHNPALDGELERIARRVASLSDDSGIQLPAKEDVEIWRLDRQYDSIDEARRLLPFAQPVPAVKTRNGPPLEIPGVSPNHVCVVSSYNSCPAGPPKPAPPPHHRFHDRFVEPLERRPATARVVVIDTGYIEHQGDRVLDHRVDPKQGFYVNTLGPGQVWHVCPPDAVPPKHEGAELSEVTGHGTFIAGIVAHRCRHAEIIVVGERREVVPLPDNPDSQVQAALYADEVSVANAVLRHYRGATVMSCGFAFPTLDAYPSSAFAAVMQVLNPPGEPEPPVIVVSPAGNEESNREYWPAAHPDVIGVASTNRMDNARAWFSNWGSWVKCCTRGQDVRSTYIHWGGDVQGEPEGPQLFDGWARWDGTSFAAPKVAAAIACGVAKEGGGTSPVAVYENLVSGAGRLIDPNLAPGVRIPHLQLG